MHKWSVTDDIVVYYFHHYGGNGLSHSNVKAISTKLGMPERSFNARIQNLIHHLTNGKHGLSNAASQTKEVADMFAYAQQNDQNFQHNLQVIVNRILK